MSYPGSPAISPEVQQRIRSTFTQTLNLAEQGSRQEAALGCDFILQLDPQFHPAQTLRERMDASSAGGGVEVGDLRARLEGRPTAEEQQAEAAALFEETRPGLASPSSSPGPSPGEAAFEAETLFAGDVPDLGEATRPRPDAVADDRNEFDDLLDLPDLPDLAAPASAEAVAAEFEDRDLRPQFQGWIEERRFADILELARVHPDRIAADLELARLATLAGERQEAAPYVERFLSAAEKARQEGDFDEAATLTEKARSLDASHPGLAEAGTLPGTAVAADLPLSASPAEERAAEPNFAAEPILAAEPLAGEAEDAFDLGDFDFGSGDEESDQRIQELLQDGQQSFDREDYQGAIDSWSRIFLIDIDHTEASTRIEEARRLKNEQERRVEEVYHEAVKAAESGRETEAREGFQRVLALSPGYAAALEQLDRLETGLFPALETGAVAPADESRDAEPADATASAGELDPDLREQIMIPPDPGGEAAVEGGVEGPKGRTMVAAKAPASRRFLRVAVVVLVVFLAAAYLLYENRDSLFPNAGENPVGETAKVDPVQRATGLHEAGKTAMAINLLRRLPPGAAQYEEAQALISQWEAEVQPAETAAEVTEPPDQGNGDYDGLIARATAAADQGDFLRARDLLTDAATVADLPAEIVQIEARVDAALAPVKESMELMDEGEYTRALPNLWRQHEDDPSNRIVRRLITDSYYNLAIRALQQGDAETAVGHLEEASEMSPEADLERHLRFARTYAQRDKDLLYRIYVKYLPAR